MVRLEKIQFTSQGWRTTSNLVFVLTNEFPIFKIKCINTNDTQPKHSDKGGDEMFFHINPKINTPLYEQLINQVKEMYAKGLLKPNEKLPSVRDLSSQMVINPNTVSKAYQELERQGVIVTIRGKGTFISEEWTLSLNPQQVEGLKQTFKQVLIDSYYAGITKNELLQWFDDVYEKMEGKR